MSEDILDRAKKRCEKLLAYYSNAHEVGEKSKRYIAGDQWEQGDQKSRKLKNRPMLTINRLSPFVNNVTNKAAMQRVKMKVDPFEHADKDTARVVSGLLTHIQYSSDSAAEKAYNTAFCNLVECGFGYFRVTTDFTDEKSFDLDIRIEEIEDPFSVLLDPEKQYAIIMQGISKEEFEERFDGKAAGDWGPANVSSFKTAPDDIVIAEYWEVTKTPTTIYKIEVLPDVFALDGMLPAAGEDSIDELDQVAAVLDVQPAANNPSADRPRIVIVDESELGQYTLYNVLSTRKSTKTVVKQHILSGSEILETNDWSGRKIPIVGMFGKKYSDENGVYFKPLVYDAIDPQRLYNYYRSEEAELLGRNNRTEWIGAEGQFEGHEDEFANVSDAMPYMEYRPITLNGQVVPPPQKVPPPQPSAGLIQSMNQSADEVKATLGMFDASIGNQGNETSGRAILARAQQGDVATYHYTLAFLFGLRELACIVVELIPHIYDTARTIRILGDDMTDEVVRINEMYRNGKGENVLYDLTAGKYDITVDIGEAFITRMMNDAENLLSFAKSIPNSAPIIGDLIAKNLDLEYSDELSSRLKATIPPGVFARMKELESEAKNPGGTDPQKTQMLQALNKMQAQMLQAQQQLQGLARENQMLKRQMTDEKIRVAEINARAKIESSRISAASDIRQAQMKQQAVVPRPLPPPVLSHQLRPVAP
jgi:hypothetical protein